MSQLEAFALTLACELLVMLALTRGVSRPHVLLAATGANCLSHPLAWRLSMLLVPETYRLGACLIELGVAVFEALWYRFWLPVSHGRAILLSLCANAASLGIGWLLWPA